MFVYIELKIGSINCTITNVGAVNFVLLLYSRLLLNVLCQNCVSRIDWQDVRLEYKWFWP